ncbi:hypothetical protein BHE74_00011162 [Ensete ventricosum]|nr:hypothetical protein BHE74_00011162 [Ensete ventricosum]
MTHTDLAAKSSRPRTARPLTWPNQRDCSKDTRCRTADLAQVRSATPTCRRTPHRQYARYGERRGSMVSHECGKVVRIQRPTPAGRPLLHPGFSTPASGFPSRPLSHCSSEPAILCADEIAKRAY